MAECARQHGIRFAGKWVVGEGCKHERPQPGDFPQHKNSGVHSSYRPTRSATFCSIEQWLSNVVVCPISNGLQHRWKGLYGFLNLIQSFLYALHGQRECGERYKSPRLKFNLPRRIQSTLHLSPDPTTMNPLSRHSTPAKVCGPSNWYHNS